MNSLPVANSLADTEDLFGNFSVVKKWSKLSTANNWYEDELFLTALDYVMNLSSTRTVINDGYPIKLSADGIMAGTYIITQNGHSGHARIISETHFNDWSNLPIVTLASTTPRQVRDLIKEVFFDQDWPVKNLKEILSFRWPIKKDGNWILKARAEHPRYSLEEFDTSLSSEHPNFILFILERISESFDPQAIVTNGTQVIADYVNQRVDLVNQGYNYCSKNKCPPNSSEYDDWSTPSRDSKLVNKFAEIDKLVEVYNKINPGLAEFWEQKLDQTKVVISGITLSLRNVRYLFEQGFTSFDPNLSPDERWGLNAAKITSRWLDKFEAGFEAREIIISRASEQCKNSCFPKTSEFVNTNSYSVDSDLNKNFVELANYCQVVGDNVCDQAIKKIDKSVTYNGINTNLSSLINRIPFFNSDPRSNLEAKWGTILNKRAVLLKNISNLKIAKNGIGVKNFNELYDFNNGHSLMKLDSNSRFIVTNAGEVFIINDKEGKIYSYSNSIINPIIDPENVLADNKDRRIEYIDGEFGFFYKKMKDSSITFRIVNNKLEFINQFNGNIQFDSNYVLMTNDNSQVAVADLKNSTISNIDFSSHNLIKDVKQLKVIAANKNEIVFKYDDLNTGNHYAILFNKNNSSSVVINSNYPDAMIQFVSLDKHKIIISSKPNDEYPDLIAIDFTNLNAIKEFKVGNNYFGAIENNTEVFFLQSKGSAWETNTKNLISWISTPVVLNNDKGEAQFILGNYVYFSPNTSADSEAHGQLLNIYTKNKVIAPKLLMDSNEFYQLQLSSDNYITYRFNTLYGDYWNMGGGFKTSTKIEESNDEIIPDFTYYSWINKESLLDTRWQKNIQTWKVLNGALFSNGLNMAIWWSE